jgi:eukaryotic translation initiation factor 2C
MYRGGGRGGGRESGGGGGRGDYGGRGGGGRRGGRDVGYAPRGRGQRGGCSYAPSSYTPSEASSLAEDIHRGLFLTEQPEVGSGYGSDLAVADSSGSQAETLPKASLPPASSKALVHAPRPGAGTVGKKCIVRANHFLVQVAENNLYHYDVSFP